MLRSFIPALLLLALHGPVAEAEAPHRATPACVMTTSTANIDGGTIAYNTAGSGPVVLLIHGLFANKEQWNALDCLLVGEGFRTIAVDVPGYGASHGFALGDYALDREAQLIHTLIRKLGIERVDVVGNSMGGAIASRYASRYPRDVRTLAFIGAPLGVVHWNRGLQDAILRGVNPFIPITEQQLDVELNLLFVHPPTIPDADRKTIVADYVARNRHYVQVWNIVNLYNDILVRTAPAVTPTLVVWGMDDHIYDVAGAQRLKRRIAHSEVHLLANAGHLLHVENAPQVAPLYVRFVQDASVTASK